MLSLKASLRRLSNPGKPEGLRAQIVRYVALHDEATVKDVVGEFEGSDGDGTRTRDTIKESVRQLVNNRRLKTDGMVLFPAEPLPLVSVSFLTRGFLAFAGFAGTLFGGAEGDAGLFWFALAVMVVSAASLMEAL